MIGLRPTLLTAALLLALPLEAAAAITITSPMNGESVASPFTVQVTYGTITECDTGGCYDTEVSSLTLFMDGVSVGSCSASTECPGGVASFEVEAAPGEHSLGVDAMNNGFSYESAESVMVTVLPNDETTGSSGGESDGSSGEGEASSGGESATTGADNDGDDKGACACTSAGGPGGGLTLLALVGLARRRRRPSVRV